jgi:hypothetical protein
MRKWAVCSTLPLPTGYPEPCNKPPFFAFKKKKRKKERKERKKDQLMVENICKGHIW